MGTAIEVFDTDAGRSRTIREDGCEAAADDERRLSELRLYRPRQSAACRPAELLRRDLQPGPVLGVKVAVKGEISSSFEKMYPLRGQSRQGQTLLKRVWRKHNSGLRIFIANVDLKILT